MTDRQFAEHIGASLESVSRIINEEISVSPDMALRLAQTIPGTDPATWLRMQADYDAWYTSKTSDGSLPMHRTTIVPERYANVFDYLLKTAPEEPLPELPTIGQSTPD